ncbi:MAG: tetratricopeptide repeat protein [Trueperaceae bacterium]
MLRTLGGLTLDGTGLTRPKPLLLLAYLCLEGPSERRHVAELFWPTSDDRMKSLGVALSRIRREAPDAVGADRVRVWSNVGCDAGELLAPETADTGSRNADEPAPGGAFLEGLYLADIGSELEEWVYQKREAVAARQRTLLLRRAEKAAGGGAFDEAAHCAAAALRVDRTSSPDVEDLRRLFVVLVAGDHPDAEIVRRELEGYGDGSESGASHLSVAEARELLRRSAGATTGASSRAPADLPPERPLVGRDGATTAVMALLDDPSTRMLTLLGPPGVGKTQLALHVAHELLRASAPGHDRFADGVAYVALASVSEPSLVVPTIAHSLGVAENPNQAPLDTLAAALAERRMLIVLDNFEQVVSAAPDVSRLLAACPRLGLMVTSRVPLRLSDERIFPVVPLDVPTDPEHVTADSADAIASIALFARRAKAVAPAFQVGADNATAVAELCVRLEGLPLALELAAARSAMLSPQAMLARFDQPLELLKGGMRDAPARHRTLREALAWSYDLLDETERALFRHLAVFAGGFSLEAVEAVGGDAGGGMGGVVSGGVSGGPFANQEGRTTLDVVAALVEKSLLTAYEARPGEPRFAMLEMVREYATERLVRAGEADAARRAHANTFLDLAEEAESNLTGADPSSWLDRLALEHGNLRGALTWAEEAGESLVAFRLGAALWRFWVVRGHMREGRERLLRLRVRFPMRKDEDQAAIRARARLLHGLGTLIHEIGDWQEARSVLELSLARWRALEDRQGMAGTLSGLAWVLCLLGEFDASRRMSQEAFELDRDEGSERGMALSLNNMGWAASFQGDYAGALALFQQSLEHRVASHDRRGVGFAKVNLGWVLRLQSRYDEAEAVLREAGAILQALGDEQIGAWGLTHLGHALQERDGGPEALRVLERSAAAWRAVGNGTGVGLVLVSLGQAQAEQGNPASARASLLEALDVARGTGHRWCEAAALGRLALVVHDAGEHQMAAAYLRESGRIRLEIQDRAGIAECLEFGAVFARDASSNELAVRALAASACLRNAIGTPRPRVGPSRWAELRDALRADLGEAFDEQWRQGEAAEPDRLLREMLAA